MTENEAKTTDFWMVTYGAPILIAIPNILALLTVFREEPLQFLMKKGDKEKALSAIKKIYETD